MIATATALRIAGLLVVAAPPPTARAPGGGAPGCLAIQIAGDPTVVEAIRARLEPRLRAMHVGLELEATPAVDVERVLATSPDRSADAPLATAWLDGRAPDAAILFMIPREGDRVLARRVVLAAGFDEVALAELTYIVERAVSSLLAAQPIGVPQAEARAAVAAVLPIRASPSAVVAPAPPAPPGLRPADASSRTAVQVGAFVGAASWSAKANAVLDGGLFVGVDRLVGAARLGLWATGEWRRSFDVVASPSDVRIGGGDAHLLLALGRRFGEYGVGSVAAGPGLMVSRVQPVLHMEAGGQAAAAQPRTDVDLALGLAVRWDVPIARQAMLFAAATADVVPLRAQYTATVEGTSVPLFSPWPVHPGFLLGIAFGAGL